MSDSPIVFKPVAEWDIDYVLENGFINSGGHALFINKQDAIDFGNKICVLRLTNEEYIHSTNYEISKVPVMEKYDYFFVVALYRDLIDNEIELLMEDDLPPLWFTRENIDKKCIKEIQRVPVPT